MVGASDSRPDCHASQPRIGITIAATAHVTGCVLGRRVGCGGALGVAWADGSAERGAPRLGTPELCRKLRCRTLVISREAFRRSPDSSMPARISDASTGHNAVTRVTPRDTCGPSRVPDREARAARRGNERSPDAQSKGRAYAAPPVRGHYRTTGCPCWNPAPGDSYAVWRGILRPRGGRVDQRQGCLPSARSPRRLLRAPAKWSGWQAVWDQSSIPSFARSPGANSR